MAPASAVAEKTRLLTRVGAAVASPIGILFAVPALVVSVAAALAAIGLDALERSALALGLEQVSVRNAIVGRQIGLALAQSDPMLDRLRALAAVHTSASPLPEAAFAMRDLMQGRPGVAYVSISYPDGTFQGGYVHDDGSLRFQDSRVESAGTLVRRFTTDDRKALTPLPEERTTYDPRTRSFYTLALASPRAVWTKPYPFFKTHYTGITRAEAVRGSDGAVRAVLTVDFDVNELSRYLERIPLAGSRVVLYSDDGTLLADPVEAARIRTLPVPTTRTLSFRDLKDPVLDAFFLAPVTETSSFTAGNRRYLMNRTGVGDPELGWHVASFVPEDVLLEPAHGYQRRAARFVVAAVLLALAIAVVFARHVVRMRKQTAEARAAATRAAAEAKDLGSYRLVARLGEGGMGEVWRAEHRLLARHAAIKLIRTEAGTGPDAQERFRREAQTLATLRSRNTIELFDYGVTEEGTFFYVMELLDGMDLETLVARFGPPPPARVRSLLIQACNSLREAHATGLIHRDIKPANLYVCRAADEVDVLKVLDFGLVRSLSDSVRPEGRSLEELAKELDSNVSLSKLTAAGAVMGTPDYMAPEQILGLDIDARADIYALGCVAYFVLCGELPFPGIKDPMATMMAHLQTDAPSLKGRVPNLPVAFAELVLRCMAKKAEERPQSVSVIRRALEEIQFPPEQAFSEEDAQDWWDQHVPRVLSVAPSAGPLSPRSALAS